MFVIFVLVKVIEVVFLKEVISWSFLKCYLLNYAFKLFYRTGSQMLQSMSVLKTLWIA